MLAGDAGAAVEVATTNTSDAAAQVDGCFLAASQSIVFIDAGIEDAGTLLDGVNENSEIVLLDSSRDAISQISKVLANCNNISQLHIVTHGQSGALLLGNQRIDAETLREQGHEIRSWSNALSPDADILLYGCETGQGSVGEKFVDAFAKLTGADVAASIDVTGNHVKGGDWDLELHSGKIESLLAFDSTSRERFKEILDVTVNAAGERGEEQFELLIDGTIVRSWVATESLQSYVYETDESITADRVTVRFINDRYEPENGIDRNLLVDNIVIDGNVFESEAATTFSTGTWLAADGVTPGFGRGDVLHANGEFTYQAPTDEPLIWNGEQWNNNNSLENNFVDSVENELVLSSVGSTSVWRTADIQAGGLYRFTVDAYKQNFLAASDQPPYASIGIDFRNAQGDEIGELIIDTNNTDPASPAVTREFVAPDGTAFATIWAWQGASPPGGSSDLRIRQIQLEQIDIGNDVTPPTAEFNPDGSSPLVLSDAGESLSFIVRYTDDVRLGQPASIRVTGPNGYDQIAVAFTGSGNGVTETNTLHGIFPELQGTPTRDWGPQDDGEYTVILEPNSLTDQAGNTTPGQVLGTFTVSILEEVDTVAPSARLETSTAQINPEGEVQFALAYQDNSGEVRFANDGLPTVTVTGPGGYEESLNGFAGFGGAGAGEIIELFLLPPGAGGYVAGEYFVSLNEGRILDESGNAAPAGPLGSFQLII